MRIARGKQGENFFALFTKPSAIPCRLIGMGKNTISTGFVLLSLGDVVALSQLSLSLWEAVAFGALGVISYGLGLWTAFAE